MKALKTILHSLFFSLLILSSGIVHGQLLVVDNASPYNDPNYLVQQILLSSGVTVSNVTFNGSSTIPTGANADMIGYFSGTSNIGLPTGVILNTGNINDAPGPNDSGFDGIDNGTSGDPDLDQLAAGAFLGTYNAAVLEFDFETVTDAISFRYVFASEEYNEYVCSSFNDVFGFFVSVFVDGFRFLKCCLVFVSFFVFFFYGDFALRWDWHVVWDLRVAWAL